jgi:hypothetical protein
MIGEPTVGRRRGAGPCLGRPRRKSCDGRPGGDICRAQRGGCVRSFVLHPREPARISGLEVRGGCGSRLWPPDFTLL